MAHTVLLIDHLYHPAGEELLAEHAAVTHLEKPSRDQVIAAARTTHGICGRYPNKIDAEVITAAEDLLVICSSGRGTDAIDIETATARGVTVVNNPGFGKVPVSEHAMFMLMSLSRHGIEHDSMTREGRGWSDRLGAGNTIRDLDRCTLGIVGFGEIGREMARKCAGAFDMTVIAYDPFVPSEEIAALGVEPVDNLPYLLARADYVTVHAELNETSHHLIDEAALRAMKPDACLINTARGKIVSQDALHRALSEGWIRAAALDVFEVEPIGPDNPLCNLSNILLSPHVGGLTQGFAEASSMSVANQMLTVFRGEYPENIRNPDAWERTKQRAMRILGEAGG